MVVDKKPNIDIGNVCENDNLLAQSLRIRSETRDDFKSIKEVHDRAFAKECEGDLVRLLRDSEDFVPELSIVAELKGEIVGHVLFSKISLTEESVDLQSLSLAPVGVVPQMHGRGIGQRLITEGITRAKTLGYRSILVVGDPGYYGKFGFRHDLVLNIKSCYACDEFAGLELVAGSLSNIKDGSAVYPDAFSVVS